ncbi:MAG TPA: BON domain-containing protein [Thermomicrobiales bacterium]|nr:BON domain-containing protein [Thermomicrobiales bacterium]
MTDQETADLVRRIHDTLAEAGIHVAVEVRDGTVYLIGEVDSEDNRQAALDVAHAVADPLGLRVDDAIDVLPDSPSEVYSDASPDGAGGFGYLDPDRDDNLVLDPGFEGDPDFTDDIGTTDPMEAAAEAVPYFPPTDPVVRPSDDEEELAVVGGFGATSMDDEAGGASFDDRPDDDISAAVLRELREDALTTDLVIRVVTRSGVVHLHGEVPTIEDAENAEEVAGRVPGVKEVREELHIPSLRGDRRG